MHTLPVLQTVFHTSFPDVHATRLRALAVAVDAVCQGSRVSITAMGRGLDSPVRIKHRVKRMNRLVGNRLLGAAREDFYRAMIRRLIGNSPEVVILMDWSDFSVDRAQQFLDQRGHDQRGSKGSDSIDRRGLTVVRCVAALLARGVLAWAPA